MERDTNRPAAKRRRAGQRTSEQRHRALLEAIPDLILHIDAEGRFLDYAPAKGQPLLIPPGEFLGRTVSEVLPAELAPRVMQRIERALQTGETQVLEYRIPVPLQDGNPRDYEARIAASGKDEVVAIVRDITRSRRAREALRENEARYSRVFEHVHDVFCRVDMDGVITHVSPSVQWWGYHPEQILGAQVADLCENPQEWPALLTRLVEDGSITDYQIRLRAGDGRVVDVSASGHLIRGPDGAVIGLEGIARDVTERRHAEKALSESEERLRGLVTNAPVIMFAIDSQGVFTVAEGKAMRLVGLSPEEHMGRSVFDMYHDLPGVIDAARRALAGEAFTTIVELQTLTFEAHVTPVRDEDGKIKGAVAVATDVTDRERAEEALRESEETFRGLAEGSIDGIAFTEGLEVRFANAALVKMLGFERDREIVGRPFTDFASPEYRELMLERGRARDEGRDAPVRYEFRALRKDGSEFDAEVSVSTTTYQGRRASQGVIRDITERKRAEEALRNSEARYRLLAENLTDVIWTADLKLNLTYVSSSISRLVGHTVEDSMRLGFEDVLTPASLESIKRVYSEEMAIESSGPKDPHRSRILELEVYRKDGSVMWVEANLAYLRDPRGRAIGVLGIARDVTGRKRGEENLRQLEREKATILDTMSELVVFLDPELRWVWANRAAAESVGLTAAETAGRHCYDIWRSRRERCSGCPTVRAADTGQPQQGEVVSLDGRVWHIQANPLLDAGGNMEGIVEVATDITERKRGEEALRQSEAKFRKLAESTAVAVFIYRGTRPLFANAATEELTGYTREEILAGELWQFVHPDFQALVRERSRARQQGAEAPSRYEFSIVRKSGEERWVDFTATMIEFDGEPAAIGTAYDITERKRAEVALRESEERFRILSEATFEGIAIHEGGLIVDANPQGAAMLGYEVAELIGKDAFSFIAPESRDLVRERTAAGYEEAYEALLLRKDGMTLLAEICGKATFYRGRQVRMGVSRDISERKRAEEALQRQRDELETRAELGMETARRYKLTFRELTVLYLVAGGMADKEIAFRLGISHRTASKHVENILSKMGAMSRTEAGVRAIQEGLVESLR